MNTQEQSIAKAISYIEENLYEELDLEEIAKVVSYSPYHFSRIFKQTTGESIFNMIKRLRLSTSIRELLHEKTNVTDIALDIGYETPSSFNKAFKKMFNCSPTQYKQNVAKELELIKKELKPTPTIISFDKEIKVVSNRANGEYNQAAIKSWTNLFQELFMVNKGNLDLTNKQFFGICYDNPNITDSEMVRFEACISYDETFQSSEKLFIQKIPRGKYAKLNFFGKYDELYYVWSQFYSWIWQKQYKLDNFPPLLENLSAPTSNEDNVSLNLFLKIL